MYKIEKQQGYIIQHREIQPLFCDNFKWSIIYKNTESLCCTPETNVILQINYTSIKNKQLNWFSGQKQRHKRREQTYGHQGGKVAARRCGDGGDGMNWEIGIDIYTLICIKWTNKNLLYKKINKTNSKIQKMKKKQQLNS